MEFKSIQIGLHADFKMKRFLLYITFTSGSSYSTDYNSWSFCNRSKLFAVLEWSVNGLLETCFLNRRYVLKKSTNESI